jgi:hypothetical protein
MKEFKKTFANLADEFQSAIQDIVKTHLGSIRVTLDMIRSDNIALESEKDPEFRARLEAGIIAAKDEAERIRRVLVSTTV